MLNLSVLDRVTREDLGRELVPMIRTILDAEGIALGKSEYRQLTEEVLDEVLGLGPLEPYLKDPTVSDILVNTHKQVFVERGGLLELTSARFKDERHLLRVIQKIVSGIGRRVDESQPWVDARLPDGSRVNALIPPCAVDGPLLSIRKFSKIPYTMNRLIEVGTIDRKIASMFELIVSTRRNVLISGGTGSGKTTLLNALSSCINNKERIITIEDTAELQLQQAHVCRVETRPPNLENAGEVTQRDLLKNALRMRPDRIIVGEVRGAEVLDMLQAMNTGHDGSMTTVHANSPRDALTRLEHMVGMTGHRPAAEIAARADRLGHPCGDPDPENERRPPARGQHPGNPRDGGGHRDHAGDLPLRPYRPGCRRQHPGRPSFDGNPGEIPAACRGIRDRYPGGLDQEE